MTELKWKDAIVKVLEQEKKALHYTEIAELIAERGYRISLGATPQDTVSAQITTDINTLKEKSIFAKVDRGYYILRKFLEDNSQLLAEITTQKEKSEKKRIVNSFGIYWNRSLVHCKPNPDLLGVQQIGATEVKNREKDALRKNYSYERLIALCLYC